MTSRSVGDALGELAGAVGDVRDELVAVRRRREREERAEVSVPSREPKRRSAVMWAHLAVPGMLGRAFARVVPAKFVTVDDHAAVVACPCGARVEVPDADLRECSCGRWYLLHRRAVRVFNPDLPVEAAGEPSERPEGSDGDSGSSDPLAA